MWLVSTGNDESRLRSMGAIFKDGGAGPSFGRRALPFLHRARPNQTEVPLAAACPASSNPAAEAAGPAVDNMKTVTVTVKKQNMTVGCSDDQRPIDAPLPTACGRSDALGSAVSGDSPATSLGDTSLTVTPPSPRRSQGRPRKTQGPSSSASRRADLSPDLMMGKKGRGSSSSMLKRKSSSSSSSSSLYLKGKRSSGEVGVGEKGAISSEREFVETRRPSSPSSSSMFPIYPVKKPPFLKPGVGGGERLVSDERKETAPKANKAVGCSDHRRPTDAPLPTERGRADELGFAAGVDRVVAPLKGAWLGFSPPSPRRSQGRPRKTQGPSSSASRRADFSPDLMMGKKGRGSSSSMLKMRSSSSSSSSSNPMRKQSRGYARDEGKRVVTSVRETMRRRIPSFSSSSSSPSPPPSRSRGRKRSPRTTGSEGERVRRRIPSFSSSSPETETMRRRIYSSSSSSPSLSPCPRRERSSGNVGGGREPVITDENETLAKKKTVAASEAKRCFDSQHPNNAPLPVGTETEPGKKPRCSSSARRKADNFFGAAGRQPLLGKFKRRNSSSSSSSSLYPVRKRSSGNIGGGGERAILGEGEKETAARAQRTVGCSDEQHRMDSPLPTGRGQADTLGTAASGDCVPKPLGAALPSFSPSSPRRSQGSPIKSQGSSSSASCRAVISRNEEGRGPFSGEPKRRTSSSLFSSPPSSPSASPPPCRSRKRSPGNAGGEGGRVIPGARESMWRTPSFSSSSPSPSPSRPLSPCPRMNESSSNVGGDGERVGLRIRVTAQGRISCSFSSSSSLCPMEKRSSGNVGGGGQAVVPGERDEEEEEEESVAKKNQTVATKRVASCFDDHQQIGAPLPIGPAAVAEADLGGKPRPSSSASLRTDYFIDEEGPGSSSGMLKRMDPYSSSFSPTPYPRGKRSSCNVGGEREGVVLSERGDETAAKNTAVAAKTASCSDDPQPPIGVGNQSSGNVGGGGEAVLRGEREKETAAAKKRAVAAKKTVDCSGGQDPIDAALPIGTETEPGGKRRSASSASRRADSFVDEGGGVSSSGMLKGGTSSFSSARCPTRKRLLSKVGDGGERVVSGQREKETVATVKKTAGWSEGEHAVGAPQPTERRQADALGPTVSGDRAAVSPGGASPGVSPPCPRRNQESPRPSQGPSSSASRRADPFVDEDWYGGWTGLGPLSGKRKKMIASSFSPSPSSQPCPRRKRSPGNSVGGVVERVTPGERGRGRVGVGAGGVRTTASPRTNTTTNTATATAANIGTPNTATATNTATVARGNSRLASAGSVVPATGRMTTPPASASCRHGVITSDMTAYQIVEVIKRVVAPEDMPALFGHVLCLQPQHVQAFCSADRSAAAHHSLPPYPSAPERSISQTSPPAPPPASSILPAACPMVVAIKAEPAGAT